MTLLDLQKNAGSIGQIFWGLWLFPLGLLVFKPGFIPKLLGILLMVGCLGYVLNALMIVLLPEVKGTTYLGSSVGFLAEILFIAWLLLRGVIDETPAASRAD